MRGMEEGERWLLCVCVCVHVQVAGCLFCSVWSYSLWCGPTSSEGSSVTCSPPPLAAGAPPTSSPPRGVPEWGCDHERCSLEWNHDDRAEVGRASVVTLHVSIYIENECVCVDSPPSSLSLAAVSALTPPLTT